VRSRKPWIVTDFDPVLVQFAPPPLQVLGRSPIRVPALRRGRRGAPVSTDRTEPRGVVDFEVVLGALLAAGDRGEVSSIHLLGE
jgi:hypothetical protein